MKVIFIILSYMHTVKFGDKNMKTRRFQDMLEEEELDGEYEPLDVCPNPPCYFSVSQIFMAVYVTFNLLRQTMKLLSRMTEILILVKLKLISPLIKDILLPFFIFPTTRWIISS